MVRGVGCPTRGRVPNANFLQDLEGISKDTLRELEMEVDKVHMKRLHPGAIPAAQREAERLGQYLTAIGREDWQDVLQKGGRDLTLST